MTTLARNKYLKRNRHGPSPKTAPAILVSLVLLHVIPARSQSLGDALDATNLIWTTGGTVSWVGETGITHDGVDAARSGTISDSQESWVQATVTGPGMVSFWWKVSSEGDYDFLEFDIGVTLQSQISGEQDWQQLAFAVPSGSQTLRWRYSKDSGTSLGQDSAWLDEVHFVPNTGPPFVLIQPGSQLVVTGATVRLQVSAAGGAPLSYQWFRDETNLLVGASTATLTLTNVQLSSAGQYRVVITNAAGLTSSDDAALTTTVLDQVDKILLFVDDDFLPSPYESALVNDGRPYCPFRLTNELDFDLAVENANPGQTLLIAETEGSGHNIAYIERFARAGGRVILQYPLLGLNSGSTAPAAFEVSVAQLFTNSPPVYSWGGSPFFTGVGTPIGFQDSHYIIQGQKLQPAGGGRAVAGFVSSATTNQAAIVIGNTNRTIVNGFILATASSAAGAAQIAHNEIQYLIGPPTPAPPAICVEPKDVLTISGISAAFQATATGAPPLNYQWFFNTTNLVTDATTSTLMFPNVQATDAGQYQLVVTNLYGAATSRVALLTITNLGPITTILLFNDWVGTTYENALTALGLPYQRYAVDTEFNAAIRNASAFTTLAVVDAVSAAGRDFSGLEQFVRSGGRAILQYLDLPGGSLSAAFDLASIQTFTAPLPVYDWGRSDFFEGVATPLTLQDFFIRDGQQLQPDAGGQAVAGFVSSPTAGQAAVVIGNSGRTIVNGFAMEEVSNFTNAVRLAQNEIQSSRYTVLTITAEPHSQTVKAGSSVTFSVSVATPAPPVRYQWQFNEMDLPGVTNSTLTITNVQLPLQGDYRVVVSDAVGSVTSQVARLTLLVAPVFAQQPQNQTVTVGSEVLFDVSISNTASLPITYRWRRITTNTATVTTNILNDYTNSYHLPSVQFSDAGRYMVAVTNAGGLATGGQGQQGLSSNAYLTVVQPPANRSVAAGLDVTLGAMVGGTSLSYQWRFSGTNLPGATSTNLLLTNVQCAQAGTYSFVVTNAVGQATGFDAVLTVVGNPPALSAIRDGTNLIVRWPQSCTTYMFEESDALGTNSWSPAGAPVAPVGDVYTATVVITETNKFYRLRSVR